MQFSLRSSLLLAALGFGFSAQAQSKKFVVAAGINAQVSHTQGSSTLTATIPGIDQMTLDLTQPGNGIFQIKTTDYNFDGYKDFAMVSANAAGTVQVYDIYLYHPADGGFEPLEVPDGACEVFGNVRLGMADKTLRSSCRNGAKSSQDIFKWADAFTLELVKSTDNSEEALTEQAEEKQERKTDQAEQRKDKRDELKDRREDQREKRADHKAAKDEGDD